MWDALGTSVDINLDNLSPYSKGAKTANPNIPMNVLKSSQTQFNSPTKPATNTPFGATTPGMSINTSNNLFNFGTPPMSPNSNQSTNKNSNFNDLDDLFK